MHKKLINDVWETLLPFSFAKYNCKSKKSLPCPAEKTGFSGMLTFAA